MAGLRSILIALVRFSETLCLTVRVLTSYSCLGRTGRIGNLGTATSFYSEKDEPLASVLTRTLLETKQEVPDFLQSYIPEGDALEHLKFEADSDYDEGEAAGGGGDWGEDGADTAWGGGEDTKADDGDAWGADESKPVEANPAESGW